MRLDSHINKTKKALDTRIDGCYQFYNDITALKDGLKKVQEMMVTTKSDINKDYTVMREDFAGHCNKIDQLEIKLNTSLADNKYYMD